MPSLRLLRVTLDGAAAAVPAPDLARLSADTAPDVVVVHGAPSRLRWRSKSAALAREAGLVVVGGGRTGGGNLLLSTLGVDVLAVRDIAFGPAPFAPGAALASVRRRDGAVALAGVRLGPRDRRGELARVRATLDELVPGAPPHCVLVGASPDALGLQPYLQPGLQPGLHRLADGIVASEGVEAGDVVPADAGAVLVELVLPG